MKDTVESKRNEQDPKRRAYYEKEVALRNRWVDYYAEGILVVERQRVQYEKLVSYHTTLSSVYSRAAKYPFWSVPTDPPEPEDPVLWYISRKQPPFLVELE